MRPLQLIPLLIFLFLLLGVSIYAQNLSIELRAGESESLPLGGGPIYKISWCIESLSNNASVGGVSIEWLGEEFANQSIGVWRPCSPSRTWYAPGGAILKLYAVPGHAPAKIRLSLERREGTVIPLRLVLPPLYSSYLPLARDGERVRAIAFIKPDRDTNGIAKLEGSEKSSWANIKAGGFWLYARGDTINLYMKNYGNRILYVKGYIILEPIQNNSSPPGQEEQPAINGSPSSLISAILGAVTAAGLLALLAARVR